MEGTTYPIVALVKGNNGKENPITFTETGIQFRTIQFPKLVNKSVEKKGWINIYRNPAPGHGFIFKSREDAVCGGMSEIVDTIEITWREPA